MPNLKEFSLICLSKDINIRFYKKLIKKLLSLKLDYIFLNIIKDINKYVYPQLEPEYYTFNELKEIYPEIINLPLKKKIYIKKL